MRSYSNCVLGLLVMNQPAMPQRLAIVIWIRLLLCPSDFIAVEQNYSALWSFLWSSCLQILLMRIYFWCNYIELRLNRERKNCTYVLKHKHCIHRHFSYLTIIAIIATSGLTIIAIIATSDLRPHNNSYNSDLWPPTSQ